MIALLSAVAISVMGFSYVVHDNYQNREAKIAEVMEFQKMAFAAYTKLGTGKYKEAEYFYKKAMHIHDEDAKTLFDYSGILARLGKHQESIEMLEKSYLYSNYKSEEVLEQLAKMFYETQNWKKSTYYYKEAIERFRPKYKYIEKIILSLGKQDKLDEAMGYFAYIQERSPEYFKDKKEFDKFIKRYTSGTKALDLLPKYDSIEDIEALLALGQGYENKGHDDKALKAYDKILLADPVHQKAHSYASEIMLRYADYAHALEHLSELEEKDFDYYMKVGSAMQELKKYDQAIKYYEKALEKNSTALLYKNLTAVSFRNADQDRVYKYLALLREKDPRMAYNFEYATVVSLDEGMSTKEKLTYQAVNTLYDIKGFFDKALFGNM